MNSISLYIMVGLPVLAIGFMVATLLITRRNHARFVALRERHSSHA